jgi:hypothetical protein
MQRLQKETQVTKIEAEKESAVKLKQAEENAEEETKKLTKMATKNENKFKDELEKQLGVKEKRKGNPKKNE